jgi:hypothetical protein
LTDSPRSSSNKIDMQVRSILLDYPLRCNYLYTFFP